MGSHSSAVGDESRGSVPNKFDVFRTYLREQDDWYRDLVDHSRDLLCVHNLEGRLLACNPAPARVLGYSVDELLKIPMRELVFPEYRDQFDAYLRQIAETGEASGVLALQTRSNELRLWKYHNTLRTQGVPAPVVRGIAHDITDQMRVAKQLRDVNQRLVEEARQREQVSSELRLFRALVDQCADAVHLVDMETLNFLDVNGSASAALGYSREELLTMGVKAIAPSITPEFHAEVIERLRSKGSETVETVHHRKDGSTFPVEVTLKRVTSDREYVVAIVRDISERKRAELALKSSESHFRMLVEQASDGIFLADSEGRYTEVNRAGAEMLGYSKQEIVQMSIADVVISEEIPRIPTEMQRLQGETVIRAEWQFRRKDGSAFPGEVTGRRLPDGRLQGILRDITERKRNELALRDAIEELRRAKEKLAEERLYLEEEIDTQMGFGEIVGQSKALKHVLAQVTTVAASDATVLVEGETGTGKELIARAIHRMSSRRGSSFIKMNCAAIPSGLMESELFGHEKGAFTGAVDRKLGRLELADRGTLFLDEIGEIPIGMQPKLLRVLQDQEFERLGGTRTLHVGLSGWWSATNRDLMGQREAGRVSQRSLLPAEGVSADGASVARPERRYSGTGGALRPLLCCAHEKVDHQRSQTGDGSAGTLGLAGEHPRVGEFCGAVGHSDGRLGAARATAGVVAAGDHDHEPVAGRRAERAHPASAAGKWWTVGRAYRGGGAPGIEADDVAVEAEADGNWI